MSDSKTTEFISKLEELFLKLDSYRHSATLFFDKYCKERAGRTHIDRSNSTFFSIFMKESEKETYFEDAILNAVEDFFTPADTQQQPHTETQTDK